MWRRWLYAKFSAFNHVRLRNKLLIIYMLCVFTPILLTNAIFYNITSENVKQQSMDNIKRDMDKMVSQLWSDLDSVSVVSADFFNDNYLNQILESEYLHPADYVLAYDAYLRRVLNSYTPIYKIVRNLRIYTDNPNVLHAGGIAYLTEDVKEAAWYKEVRNSSTKLPVFTRTPREDMLVKSNNSDTFSIVQRMTTRNRYNKWEHILKLELNMASIDEMLSNLNVPSKIYLIDSENEVQYANIPEFNWDEAPLPFDTVAYKPDSIPFEKAFPSNGMVSGWRLIAVVSEEEISKELAQSRKFALGLTVINLLVPTLILAWISRSITARLGNIFKHMKRVKNQNFAIIMEEETRDEIGQLTEEFNRMTVQIRNLINDVYMADIKQQKLELERRKAQLNALQSQINPHFLFNALETIRMRSIIKKETETASIIHHMAKLFRNSLTWKKDLVKVAEELEFITAFLEIQHYRFGERLTYHLHCEEETGRLLIPKFVFLPFVENACMHGIEQKKQGGHIDIRLEQADEHLRFSISDNGKGMTEQQAEKIRQYLHVEDEIGERIGVQNVIYRLKLIYGSSFTFHLQSKLDQGTELLIELPIMKPHTLTSIE